MPVRYEVGPAGVPVEHLLCGMGRDRSASPVQRPGIERREDQDMPGEQPQDRPGGDSNFVMQMNRRHARLGKLAGTAARLLASVATPMALLLPASAAAQSLSGEQSGAFSTGGILLLAIWGGAMSFATLSATWLIRERARMTGENEKLKERLVDLRAMHERMKALVHVSDQRIVIWDGIDEKPEIIGSLSRSCGAPADRAAFLAFGRWLETDSAISFEGALKRLRSNAEAFDLPLMTKTGALEAQGRTSGGHAFVRFIELSGERSALARLETEHARLMATFDTIQALFEKLPTPVWMRDANGELFWVNAAYARAVDCDSGENAVDRRMPLLDSAERSEVQRQQRENGFFAGSLPAVVSGDRRVLDVTEVMTEAGFAALAVDRSEIEAVQENLRETAATHAQTLDHLATAVAMFDSQQRLQFFNSSFQKLFGLSVKFLETKPDNAQLLDAIRAERKLPEVPDWRKWREAQLDIYRARDAREDWWHMPDGRTLRVVVNPHNHGGATWVFENVTEQIELRSNLNSLIRVQGETLDNLSEAVAVFGSDGKLKLCNPAFRTVWSLGPQQPETGTHISGLSPELRKRLKDPSAWQPIEEAITGLDDLRADLSRRLDMADGKVVDFAIVRLPEGLTMLAAVDMTAAVSVERALTERNEALEQADRLKNNFLQHVSYELRAPLTSISGFAELLQIPAIGTLNGKQEEYVGHISASADTLKSVIDAILDLASIDAGAMTLDIEPIDMRGVIEECREALALEMAERSVAIEATQSSLEPRIPGDRKRLRQILENLLSNAIRFSPDGSTVRISLQQAGEWIELAVTDEGPGIADGDMENIFQRFERGRSGDRRGGAGLGLSVVRSFVELHGGTVRVENVSPRGARFVCRFPSLEHAGKAAA
jgi:signal transduction histidine kinase